MAMVPDAVNPTQPRGWAAPAYCPVAGAAAPRINRTKEMSNQELNQDVSGEYARGVNKVERYQWKPPGDEGRFDRLPKTLLILDSGEDGYQRSPQHPKALDIARDFAWEAFGTLLVALTLDGKFFCYEGGHRLAAAMLRSDIAKVPCMIYRMETRAQQAQMFLLANTRRKQMDANQKHKAGVCARDSIAIAIDNLMEEFGYRPSKDKGNNVVGCVAALRRCYETDAPAARQAFALATEIANGRMIHDILLQGLFYIWRGTDTEVGKSMHRCRLVHIGMDELIAAAKREAATYAKGGQRIWAEGMIKAINKGRPARNHLELRKPKDACSI